MYRHATQPRRILLVLLTLYTNLLYAVRIGTPNVAGRLAYKSGDKIPISCLNRTIDTGEHVSDAQGQLQYIPFPTCNETGAPLALHYGLERDTNCTIPFITDEFFHLLEFYIHSDAPLSCRIPARPLSTSTDHTIGPSSATSRSDDYIPMIFALSGTLSLSHLHISTSLNILLHTQSPSTSHLGVIDSATAYSTSPLTDTTRVVIGDALPLRLSVRWYPTTSLPSGWRGVGGHLEWHTLVYCLLCVVGTAVGCVAWFRGVEIPKRLKGYGAERVSGGGGGYGYGYSGQGTGGYGIGPGDAVVNGAGSGYGWGMGGGRIGKSD